MWYSIPTLAQNTKLVKKAWPRSRDLEFEFWDPIIALEGLKLQTSNFACILNDLIYVQHETDKKTR